MVTCRPGHCTEPTARAQTRTGGPVFLPPREPSDFARTLLAEPAPVAPKAVTSDSLPSRPIHA